MIENHSILSTRYESANLPPINQCITVYEYYPVCEISFSHLTSQNCLQISVVVSGNGTYQILDQSFPCEEGDIYITNANVPHGFFPTEGKNMTVRHLQFDVDGWFEGDITDPENSRFCFGIFTENPMVAYAKASSRTREILRTHMDAIGEEMTEREHEWEHSIRAHLSLILITLGRYINGAIKNISPVQSKKWRLISTVLRMVSTHFNDSGLTLGSIADSLFVSKSHLSRLFCQLTGETFSNYLRTVRLKHACTLLQETDLTVEEIVTHCGLKDVPTFYHTFHNTFHMTPNQYRLQSLKPSLHAADNHSGDPELFSQISAALQRGKINPLLEQVQQAISRGYSPEQILSLGLLPGMNKIGEKFKNNEVYVPEVLVAARAMNSATGLLKSHFPSETLPFLGRVCLGTVQGDLHDIGKNLVKIMMESKGLEVIDLGTDVSPDRFIEETIRRDCQIICCSALLSTTMYVMEDVVKKAQDAGIRDKIKIMIGGAPTSEAFCHQIGADCYTEDAAAAADAAISFLYKMNHSLHS